MSLNTRMQAGMVRMCRAAGTARSYQELTHAGVATGSAISSKTISTFPEANAERGIKAGAELLQVDPKPFDDASKALTTGNWEILAAGGTGVDLEITGLVTGDLHVGYEVLINPKASRVAA